ncbi:L,D-transpeptidase family protein [Chitinibacter sp. GC72]|uniref:L,D-transpeptidase family protein n=1 Tax=Chitinibacter sp. GC72 TaxID=1526917 RepID=UPI0012FB373E|nr:L,D-transpeptidase family protein [Chitinibacter sp. GC72]
MFARCLLVFALSLPALSAQAVEQAEISALAQYAQSLAPGNADTSATQLSAQRPLRRGSKGADVALVRQRLNELGFSLAKSTEFDTELDATVREYQLGLQMKEDGIIDKQTRFNLNLTDARRRELLQWQLPQMQSLREQAPARYVVINIPAYTLVAYENGQAVIRSRIVIGKNDRPTPLLRTQIAAIKYNPNWSVPPVVIKNDLTKDGTLNLAKVQKHRLRMLDTEGNEVDPAAVAAAGETDLGRYRYVQDPGAKNALGRLKFELTASNGIYLHDTPSKGLFGKENRAASSGCVRVQEWQALASWALGVNEQQISRRIASKKTYTEALAEPVRVYFVYWPAQIEGEGIRWYDDIYRAYLSPRGVNSALTTHTSGPPSTVSE